MKYVLFYLLIPFIFISCATNKSNFFRNYSGNIYKKNGYTLVIDNNAPGFADSTKRKLVETFFTVYPAMAKDLNPNTAKTVYFVVDTAFTKYPAATFRDTVRYSAQWFATHPEDIDVVTHEVMHIVQSGQKYDPWWIIEGMADYVRYKYGVANEKANWHMPMPDKSQNYDNGYRVTARFIAWVDKKIKPGFAYNLNTAMAGHTYNQDFWKNQTGKTAEELWQDYLQDPAL